MRPRYLALLAVLATAACTGSPAPPPVVRVDRGPVVTTVSASGTLVGISRQNLGFTDGGELAEVLVKVGDRVEAGQVLARLENFELGQALERAQAQLDAAQAQLDKVTGSNAVNAAENNVEQAREVLAATEKQVRETDESNRVAVDRAEVELDFRRDEFERAKDQLDDAKDAEDDCDDSTSTDQGNQNNNNQNNQPPASSATSAAPSSSAAPDPDEDEDGNQGGNQGGNGNDREDDQRNDAQGPTLAVRPVAYRVPAQTQISCQQAETNVQTAENNVETARGQVIAAETSLATAKQTLDVQAASGRVSIENARSTVVSGEGTLGSAATDLGPDTSLQEAQLREAQVAVNLAERDVEKTTLRAPTGGIVSQLNGAVGETLSPLAGATTLAPGSTARLPQLASNTGTGTGTSGTGGGSFITLDGVDTFQLVVPFEESDAAQVRAGLPVAVSVDAVQDRVLPAQVVAVAPSGTDVSGIVNYYATIVLTEGDPLLRDGQTAEASVEVDAVLDALRLPSSVIGSENGQRVVTLVDGTQVPVTLGLEGDEFSQVLTGANLGQEVQLPQGEVSAVTTLDGPPE